MLNDDTNETITITLKNCQTKNEIDLSGYSIDENTIQILNFADIKYCFRLEVFKYKEEDKYDYYDDMYIGKDINTIDSRKIEFSCCDFELAITDTNKILAEYDKYANEHLLSKNNTFDKFVVNYFWLNSIDDYGVLDNNLTFYSENVTDKTSTVCFKNYNIRFFLTGKEIQEQEFISSLNILLDKYNQENNTNYQLKKSILGHCFSNVIYKKEANKETIKFYFSGDHEFLIECDDIIFN